MAGSGEKQRPAPRDEVARRSGPEAPSVGRIMGRGFGVVVLLLVLAVAAGLVSLLLVRDAQEQLNKISPVRLLNTQADPVILALRQMGGPGGITVGLYPPTVDVLDQYLGQAEQQAGFDAELRQDLAVQRAAVAAWRRGYG
nr:hypothetical protein [Micromonospora sp. DSM 115978]